MDGKVSKNIVRLLRAGLVDPTDIQLVKRALIKGEEALVNPTLRIKILEILDKLLIMIDSDPALFQRTRSILNKESKDIFAKSYTRNKIVELRESVFRSSVSDFDNLQTVMNRMDFILEGADTKSLLKFYSDSEIGNFKKKFDNPEFTLLVKEEVEGRKISRKLDDLAENHGIEVGVLTEVYDRGFTEWSDSDKTRDRKQYAFDRVHSFVNGGYAAKIDSDLKEEKEMGLDLEIKRSILESAADEEKLSTLYDLVEISGFENSNFAIDVIDKWIADAKAKIDDVKRQRRKFGSTKNDLLAKQANDIVSQQLRWIAAWEGEKKKLKRFVKEENYDQVPEVGKDFSTDRFATMTPGEDKSALRKAIKSLKKGHKDGQMKVVEDRHGNSATVFWNEDKWMLKEELVTERELSDKEERDKESIVKKLKTKKDEFKDRYGDDAKSVMYAVATKQAKNEAADPKKKKTDKKDVDDDDKIALSGVKNKVDLEPELKELAYMIPIGLKRKLKKYDKRTKLAVDEYIRQLGVDKTTAKEKIFHRVALDFAVDFRTLQKAIQSLKTEV